MSSQDTGNGGSTRKEVGLWVVTGVLSAAFVMLGAMKVMGAQMQMENFARWGYPDWFRVLIGAVEILAGAVLVWKAVTPYAATLLIGVMAGAAYTHLANNEAMTVFMPLTFLGLLFAVAWARRPAWVRKGSGSYRLVNGRKSG